MPYYLCPVSNSTFNLTPDEFGPNSIYLEFSISVKRTANLTFAIIDINNKRPRLNLIYRQIGINIDSKTQPFDAYIENMFSNIDYDFVKRTEMGIYPQEIMEDSNFISAGSYQHFIDSSISSQKNGTVFTLFRKSDFFGYIIDRSISLTGNDNAPFYTLAKLDFRIGSSTNVILRNYDNLSNFLAQTGSILSNLLLVFMIVMSKVNQINGKNLLLESMFSYDAIKNILKFNKDIKQHFIKFKSNEFDKSHFKLEEKSDKLSRSQLNLQEKLCNLTDLNLEEKKVSSIRFEESEFEFKVYQEQIPGVSSNRILPQNSLKKENLDVLDVSNFINLG